MFADCLKPFRFSLHWVSYKYLSFFTAFRLLSLLHFPLLHFQRPRLKVVITILHSAVTDTVMG